MHGQQNDKYTEMHGQQNDKYTEMHGQQNAKTQVLLNLQCAALHAHISSACSETSCVKHGIQCTL
jgi:hypothetical protein